MAYALLLSQEEEEARRRSVPVEATVAAPEATQPSSSGPVDDNEMDDPLRQALERSLLDQSVEADDDDDDQFELLFDDDALVAGAGASSSSAAAGRPLYSASPVRPSWCAQEVRPSSSSLPSAAPTPVFGSFDDRTEWPAMLSSSPPPVGKGKQQQQPQQAASSPVPSAPRPSGQLAWSSVDKQRMHVALARRSGVAFAAGHRRREADDARGARGRGAPARPRDVAERPMKARRGVSDRLPLSCSVRPISHTLGRLVSEPVRRQVRGRRTGWIGRAVSSAARARRPSPFLQRRQPQVSLSPKPGSTPDSRRSLNPTSLGTFTRCVVNDSLPRPTVHPRRQRLLRRRAGASPALPASTRPGPSPPPGLPHDLPPRLCF
jgi:hypothetical protein